MSTKDFQFNSVTSYPYQFGSDPTRLHETFLGSDPNGITFKSDPVWVRIADPNGFGSVESRVNARPIRYSLGTDPFGSDLVSTGPYVFFLSTFLCTGQTMITAIFVIVEVFILLKNSLYYYIYY